MKIKEGHVIEFGILLYWAAFWAFNVVDKFVGGVEFLWVGKDFFALFIKFFSSIGIKNPHVATFALVVIAVLEIVAFVLCTKALIHYFLKDEKEVYRWFFWGILTSIVLFSIFTIGDQLFGDRFQLLEHTLFWLAIIVSWAAFTKLSSKEHDVHLSFTNDVKIAFWAIVILSTISSFSIIDFQGQQFPDTYTSVDPVVVGNGIYRLDFPFLADKTVWEKTLDEFIKENPDLAVTYVYTAPGELKSKKADNVLVYLFTEKK